MPCPRTVLRAAVFLAAAAVPASSLPSAFRSEIIHRLSAPPDNEPEGASFAGLSVSLGAGRRVTARVTFDKKKAAQGGFILAAPSLSPSDSKAVRLSEAVIATSGGLLSFAAVAAREHGVAALVLPGASWESGPNIVLVLGQPVFGRAKKAEGFTYQLAEKTIDRRIHEGDVVTVDAGRSLLRIYPPEEQDDRLALAEALRAFDGLRDAQSLMQWFQGRLLDASSSRARLGAWLVEEMAERAASGGAGERDFARVREAVMKTFSSDNGLRETERRWWARRLREDSARAKETEENLRGASSRDAVARLAAESKKNWERLAAVGRTLNRAPDLAPASAAFARIKDLAQNRLKKIGDAPDGTSAVIAFAGAKVPQSLRVKAELYRRFIAENGLEAKIKECADDASLDLRRKSARLRALITESDFAPEGTLGREVDAALPSSWEEFLILGAGESRLARRQSWREDLKKAWASLWSPAQLGARKRSGKELSDDEISIFIQEKAAVDSSGVVLTRGVAGGRPRLIVDAAVGAMEETFSGAAADQYVLDAASGREILPAIIGRPDRGRVLSAEQLERLARVGAALEDHFGCALEIRFSFAGDTLIIAQVRPIDRFITEDSAAFAEQDVLRY